MTMCVTGVTLVTLYPILSLSRASTKYSRSWVDKDRTTRHIRHTRHGETHAQWRCGIIGTEVIMTHD